MKTIFNRSQLLFFSTLTLFIIFSPACKKNSLNPNQSEIIIDESTQLQAEDLNTYQGEIGLLFDTRSLLKKGYEVNKIAITTTAAQGDYDQEIMVDSVTHLAKLSLLIENLSESAENELRNGVGVTYTALSENGNTILSETSSKILFRENGNKVEFNVSGLAYAQKELSFSEDMAYFLQIVDADGSYSDQVVEKDGNVGADATVLYQDYSTFNASWSNHQYYFQAHPEFNVFSIYSKHSSRYLNTGDTSRGLRQSGVASYPISPESLNVRYKFIIRQEENGLFTINDINGKPMRKAGELNGKTWWKAAGSGEIQYFRIVALDIDWSVEELGTHHLQPIFPAAKTYFGFNGTLINCGTGSLEQEVGIEKSVTTTFKTGYEESISVASRTTASISATVGATAEASFFGNGGSVSAEVSTSVEVSTEVTKSRSQSQEFSKSETESYFSKRTVMVPSGKASLVYDAYQTYENVQVPFVKRFLVRGTNTQTSTLLSGKDIATQFSFMGFNGVITEVGIDYIGISIRGTTILNNILDTTNGVEDVPGKCD